MRTSKEPLDSARAFLRQTLPPGARVLCAVSGGLDSMCLLDLMSTWGREQSYAVTAAHFHHQLRGETADRDERFVRDSCKILEIPFVSGRGDTRALAEADHLSIEEAARKLRYAFLERAAAEHGCAWILTAHHADDSAETMLLNLLRGTGLKGLTGIPAVRGRVCRPFLEISRAELEQYAGTHGISHVEDETNQTDDAARNVLRHRVLPVLKELNPRAVENMMRTAALLREDEAVLDADSARLTALARPIPNGYWLKRSDLAHFHPASQKRAVLELTARLCGCRQDLSSTHILEVLELAFSENERAIVSLPYGVTARFAAGVLFLEKKSAVPEAVPITMGEAVSFGMWKVMLCEAPEDQAEEGQICYALNAAALTGTLSVTAWRTSDRLRLPGSRGARSVKRLCVDRGISPQKRDLLPVFRAGETPVGVPFLGIDRQFAPLSDGKVMMVIFYKKTEENQHDQ